jgi:hypothetical protein
VTEFCGFPEAYIALDGLSEAERVIVPETFKRPSAGFLEVIT